MSDSPSCGNLILMSTRTNLWLGVAAAEGTLLPRRERSCDQVTVADCRAIIWLWSSRGGTGIISAPLRYFSIRRRDTIVLQNSPTDQSDTPDIWCSWVTVPGACWWVFQGGHLKHTSFQKILHCISHRLCQLDRRKVTHRWSRVVTSIEISCYQN